MRPNSKNYSDQQNCVHAWAHQLSPAGHASNLYFTGSTIYSYGSHFPIATIDGDRVFFTTLRYSPSTSQHKSRVRSAVSHLNIIFVTHVPVSVNPAADESFIRKNVDEWVSEIQRLIYTSEQYPRRTSIYQEINTALSRLNSFIFELDIIPDKSLKQLLDHPSLQTIADHHAALKLKAAAAEKKRITLLSELFVGLLRAWRKDPGNTGSLYNPEDPNLAYLRWNEATRCVETSKGIKVPLQLAKKCYDFVQSQLPQGCCNCQFSLLGFQVTNINNEFLTVGCHKISMGEISAMATQLGWD